MEGFSKVPESPYQDYSLAELQQLREEQLQRKSANPHEKDLVLEVYEVIDHINDRITELLKDREEIWEASKVNPTPDHPDAG